MNKTINSANFSIHHALIFFILLATSGGSELVAVEKTEIVVSVIDLGRDSQINGKVVPVTEVFRYGCDHCPSFHEKIQQWSQVTDEKITFKAIPILKKLSDDVYDPLDELAMRAHYVADQLGMLERVRPVIHRAVKDRAYDLLNTERLVEFFARMGGNEAEIDRAQNAFAILAKVSQSRSYSDLVMNKIKGVPMVIVGDKYAVGPGQVNGFHELIVVIEYLVDRVRSEH
ncbi:MAG: DsbA family protein [Halomonas sp.]|nr:DsbA family protein [Halomonas sp.]